jgi:hypothetical protein
VQLLRRQRTAFRQQLRVRRRRLGQVREHQGRAGRSTDQGVERRPRRAGARVGVDLPLYGLGQVCFRLAHFVEEGHPRPLPHLGDPQPLRAQLPQRAREVRLPALLENVQIGLGHVEDQALPFRLEPVTRRSPAPARRALLRGQPAAGIERRGHVERPLHDLCRGEDLLGEIGRRAGDRAVLSLDDIHLRRLQPRIDVEINVRQPGRVGGVELGL